MKIVLNNFSTFVALVVVCVVGFYSYGATETASKARLQSQMLIDAFELNGTAVIAATRAGIIENWSDVAEGIFGYPESEIVGLPVETLISEANRDSHSDSFRDAMGNRESEFWVQGIRCTGRHKSGKVLDLHIKTWVAGDRAIAVITPAERIRYLPNP